MQVSPARRLGVVVVLLVVMLGVPEPQPAEAAVPLLAPVVVTGSGVTIASYVVGAGLIVGASVAGWYLGTWAYETLSETWGEAHESDPADHHSLLSPVDASGQPAPCRAVRPLGQQNYQAACWIITPGTDGLSTGIGLRAATTTQDPYTGNGSDLDACLTWPSGSQPAPGQVVFCEAEIVCGGSCQAAMDSGGAIWLTTSIRRAGPNPVQTPLVKLGSLMEIPEGEPWVRYECVDADGQVTEFEQQLPVDSIDDGIVALPEIEVQCPDGMTPKHLWVEERDRDSGEIIPGIPPAVEWEQDGAVLDPAGPLADCIFQVVNCELRVVRIAPDGITLLPCDPVQGNCSGWWDDPLRQERYKCLWGPHELPLSQCAMLRNYYNPATAGQITPTPAQQPAPGSSSNPATNPGQVANPGPAPDPAELPGGLPQPGLGTLPPPTSWTWTAPPVAPSIDMESCVPQGNAVWNPLAWVAKPVACVLVWAFVPQTLGQHIDAFVNAAQTRIPVSWIVTIVAVWNDLATPGTGCVDWSFNPPGVDVQAARLIDTCTPGSFEGQIMSWRPMMEFGMWLIVITGVGWLIFRQYLPGSMIPG